MMKKLLVCALATAAIASSAMAISLTTIEPLAGMTTTVPKQILSNGLVVGQSGTLGFVWDATNGTRGILSSDGAQAENAFGAAYRTVGGAQQLVIAGGSAGGYGTFWFSGDNGATFGPKVRDTTYVAKVPAANGMAGTATDTFYATLQSGDFNLKVGKGTGAPAAIVWDNKSTAEKAAVQGVSSTGTAVGRRKDSFGIDRNYMLTWNGAGTPTAAYFNGLAGNVYGGAWSIAGDGTSIFGISPVADGRANNWPYKYTVGGATQELPSLPNTDGSVNLGLPYGASQSGNYAVGMGYVGREQAVLWNCPGTNPADWTVTDLTTYFSAKGMLGNFDRLSRAYSISEDGNGGYWIAGVGVEKGTLATKGFVAYIPEPATLSLLALGGLAMLRRRH